VSPGRHQPQPVLPLEQYTILQVHPSPKDWDIWLKAHKLTHLDPNSGLLSDSYDHALATAAQGLGVALAMQFYITRELDAGILVEPLPGERVDHVDTWYFVCRKEHQDSHKISVFSNWLAEQFESDETGSA
jgi:LysR family glycine cleavage system transcriptional activator